MKQSSYLIIKISRILCSLITLAMFCSIFLLPRGCQEIARLQFLPNCVRATTVVAVVTFTSLSLLLLLTLVLGRLYCSFLCPLGVVQDIAIRLKKMIVRSKRRSSFTLNHRLLRYSFFAMLVAAFVMGSALPLGLFDPFSAFGRFGSAVLAPGFIWINNFLADSSVVEMYPRAYAPFSLAVLLVGGGFLFVIFVVAFFWNRLFCNTLCPVGALLGIFSRFSWYKIGFNSDACIKCGKCAVVCKAGCIDYKNGIVDSERCVGCLNCLTVCSFNAISYMHKKLPDSVVKTPSRRAFMVIGGASAVGAVLAPTVLCKGHDGNIPVMPPGAVDFKRFSSKCTACQLCVSNCPGNVLKPASFQYGLGGFLQPRLDFDSGMCEFDCTVCSDICPSGALITLSREKKQVIQLGVAEFTRSRCIVKTDHTHCGACAEHCPTGAVHMVPWRRGRGGRGGGRGRGNGEDSSLTIPQVEPELCIGCGACEFVCPVLPIKAIIVNGLRTHGIAEIGSSEQAVDHLEGQSFPF